MAGESDKYTFKIDIDANELSRKLEKAFERALKAMKIPTGGSGGGGRYLGISAQNLERMNQLLEKRTAEKIKQLTAETNMARGLAALEKQYYIEKRKQVEDLKLQNRIKFRAELEAERMKNALRRASVTKYNWREVLAKDPENRYAASMGRREQMYYQHPGMLSALGLHNLQERMNKTGIFSPTFTGDKRKGGMLKQGLGMLGIGLGGAALSKMIIDSSPLLQGMMKLMQTTFMLVLRPIGDFFAGILMPIATMLLPAAATFYSKTAPKLFLLGQGIGKALTGDFAGAHEKFQQLAEMNTREQFSDRIFKHLEDVTKGRVKTMPAPDGTAGRVDDNLQNRAKKAYIDTANGWASISDFFTKTIPDWVKSLLNALPKADAMIGGGKGMPVPGNPYYFPGGGMAPNPGAPWLDKINDPRLKGKTVSLEENFGMGDTMKKIKEKTKLTEEDNLKIKEIWDNIEDITSKIRDGSIRGLSTEAYQMLQHMKTAKQSGKDINESMLYVSNLFAGVYDKLRAQFAALYSASSNGSSAERVAQIGLGATTTPIGTNTGLPVITKDGLPLGSTGKNITADQRKIESLKAVMAFNLLNPLKTYGSIYGRKDNYGNVLDLSPIGYGEIKSVSDIKAFLTTNKAWSSRWDGVTKLASGGILNEPVMGTGLSTGRRYMMGEAGAEAVVPLNKMGGGNINMTFNISGGNSDEVARKIKMTVLQVMKEESDRRGRL